jgi:hypothetical protein
MNQMSQSPHIHIDRDDSSAKFWLESVILANNIGFSAKELRKLQSMVKENLRKAIGGKARGILAIQRSFCLTSASELSAYV